jgi:hypothetical protein
MALALITVMIITSQAVLRSVVTEGRRAREAEMIWRGDQCIRAIRMYYRKTGKYPQSMDDLEKGVPGVHFLRAAAFKDPMNQTDGTWRFIYVNAAGQIFGSTKYGTLQQMALIELNNGQMPAAAAGNGTNTNTAGDSNGADANSAGANPPSSESSQQQTGQSGGTGQNTQPQQSGFTSSFSNSFSGTSSPPLGGALTGGTSATNPFAAGNALANMANAAQPQPTGPVDGPVVGAFVVGVAGGNNYNGNSIRWYKGAKKYQEWEFIWNPLIDQARAIQSGFAPQTGAGQTPGQPGAPGQSNGFGLPITNPNGGAPPPPANPPTGTGQQPDQPQQQQ